MQYTCSHCGQQHESWPALAYNSPDNYDTLSPQDKETIAEIAPDICIIRHPDQTDRFIRCTLTQQVYNHCEDLNYGLWVSLSEQSFADYLDNYNNENHEAVYFGWLCNQIPEYDFRESIPTTVYTKTGSQRPEIIPHQSFDHPFVTDYYSGISKAEAEKRIQRMMGQTPPKDMPEQ